jgi:pimeloyl-ACP methyl ester carboxylesterase
MSIIPHGAIPLRILYFHQGNLVILRQKGTGMPEQEIRFHSDGIDLSGTLALPSSGGPFPAVLFLAGSGQIDRNENSKQIRLNAFYEIARFLVRNGIASLRYDKRGVGRSEGDYWSSGFQDHLTDALAALKFLKQQAEVQAEKIFLLGHSEGAFLAARMSGGGAETAGVILLAGGAKSGEAVLKWQALQVVRGLTGMNRWIIDKFHIDVSKEQEKQLEKIKKSTAKVFRQNLFVKINAKWLREFMAYDPAADLARISVPVLAITGSKDIQTDPADLERMARLVKAPFESHRIQNMTHILREEKAEPSLSNYKREIKQPLEPQLLEIILPWLAVRTGLHPKAME